MERGAWKEKEEKMGGTRRPHGSGSLGDANAPGPRTCGATGSGSGRPRSGNGIRDRVDDGIEGGIKDAVMDVKNDD